ncbi:MAG: peptide-methionine (S)-S-oxide reductase MsrA [Patescibacteria group bacterium]
MIVPTPKVGTLSVAVFGGGCFWCTEAVFKMLKGVSLVLPGYAGGTVANPTYAQVCDGNTGHAECVKVEYDSAQVSYRSLLTVFFGSHDPTTRNRQGADVGTQYRSVIFTTTPEQAAETKAFIAEINTSSKEGKTIVTDVEPLAVAPSPAQFWVAENYHQDYFARNPGNPYCELVINPKLEKVTAQFAELLAGK